MGAERKFEVIVGNDPTSVTLSGNRLIINGEDTPFCFKKITSSLYSLVLNDRSYEIGFTGPEKSPIITIDGRSVEVEVKSARTLLLEQYTTKGTASQKIADLRAPMPGLVLRVSVNRGDIVQEGQSMVVLEAMKMENDLRASTGGIVKAVHASKGASVAKNALLVEFEPQ